MLLTGKILLLAASAAAPNSGAWPFAILRSYGSYVRNRTFTDRVFAAQERHPGLFGEIWFSGCGDPFSDPETMGRTAAEENLAARERCRKLGVAFSYQQGVTLNHGPDGIHRAAIPDDAWAADWKGERKYGLFCANSTAARDFGRKKAKSIMAALQPDSYWPDDDLRITKVDWNAPAICYCTNCLALFGEKTGRTWTREALVAALTGPDASAEVRRQWCAFNGETLGDYARIYREAAEAVSPKTRLGIQGAFTASGLEGEASRHVVKALAGEGGRVGIRPGFGYYHDQEPRKMLEKMIHVAREAARSACLPETAQICYECENWPHVGAHKNPHGQMAECALALAMGCDSIAFYWGADQNGEDAANDNYWLEAVAAWRPFHLAVRDAFAGTRLGGLALFYGEGRYGVDEWMRLPEDVIVRLAGNGLPVAVPEAEPDAWLVDELTVRTLVAADLPCLFARPTLMEPHTLTALAKRFPSLAFPSKVKVSPLPAERAEATDRRTNGYERFPSGLQSDKLQAFVYPQADDVLRFSEMTNDPKAAGMCVVPTEFGGVVVLAQDANGEMPHVAWPGGRRHAILDALDAAVPGGMPVRILTDGYALSVSVRKTADGRTAGAFVLNLGMGETPPLELAIRKGVVGPSSWSVMRPKLADAPAEAVRASEKEAVVRVPPLAAFGVALVAPADGHPLVRTGVRNERRKTGRAK